MSEASAMLRRGTHKEAPTGTGDCPCRRQGSVCAAHQRGAVRFDQLRALDANHEERQQPVPARLARARAPRGEGRAKAEVPSLTCRAPRGRPAARAQSVRGDPRRG